jgi:hypothetical protein
MRLLSNIPNTDAPDSNYPGGRIRNKNNSTVPPVIGTPIIEELYGDIVQFFQRLLVLGSVTPNELPDNVTNGYQLIEALTKALNGGYFIRTIEIGAWDMDTDGSKIIDFSEYGDLAEIRILEILILNDAQTIREPIYKAGGYTEQFLTTPTFYLQRNLGGMFDSNISYASTSVNRGFITFAYKP